MSLKKISFFILLGFYFNSFSQDLTFGLKAHFSFDSTLNDISGNGEHLTTNDSIAYSNVALSDYSIDFDGTQRLNSLVSYDNSAYTASSVSIWFKTSTLTTTDDQTLLQGANMGFGVHILPTTGKVGVFFDTPASASLRSSGSVVDGSWHNVIGINDGTTTYLYLDGSLLGTKSESLNVGNGASDNKLYIGKTNLNVRPYSGLINNVRIYNRSLLDCEIDILSDSALQLHSLSANLQAHFKFDSTINDASGNSENLSSSNGEAYLAVSSNDESFNFDGTNRLASINSFDNSYYTEASISLWFKTSTLTTTDDQTLLQGAYMGFGIHILPTTGKVGVFFDPASSTSLRSSGTVVDGSWHNVIGINDGTTTYLYLDGSLVGSQSENLNVGNGGSNNKLYLGKTNQNVRPYTGLINDVRIYSKVLDTCEIYNLALDSISSPLLKTRSKLTTLINSHDESLSVNIYPNPSYGDFILESYPNKIDRINIISSNGKIIQTIKNVANNSYKLVFNNYSKGLYYLQIVNSNGYTKTKKIIKL